MPDQTRRVPTVADVAQLAGVSTMTVSRTFNDHPAVRPATRARVLRASELLGYRRNENARSLRPGHRSGLIGLGITNIANPYYAEFALGVEEVASRNGRRVILATTRGRVDRERQVVADFLGRQIEGIILVPAGPDGQHLRDDHLRGIPLVLASRTVEGVTADTVVIDDVGGARAGTGVLLDRGHTRIGYLGTSTESFTGGRRLRGFMEAHAERGFAPPHELQRTGCQTADDAALAARELLRDGEVTAFFCSNNRNTVGLLKALAEQLEDTALAEKPDIASFDNFELSDLIGFPLTIINHDAKALGAHSAQLLFDRLDGGRQGSPAKTTEMPTWISPGGLTSRGTT